MATIGGILGSIWGKAAGGAVGEYVGGMAGTYIGEKLCTGGKTETTSGTSSGSTDTPDNGGSTTDNGGTTNTDSSTGGNTNTTSGTTPGDDTTSGGSTSGGDSSGDNGSGTNTCDQGADASPYEGGICDPDDSQTSTPMPDDAGSSSNGNPCSDFFMGLLSIGPSWEPLGPASLMVPVEEGTHNGTTTYRVGSFPIPVDGAMDPRPDDTSTSISNVFHQPTHMTDLVVSLKDPPKVVGFMRRTVSL